MVESVTASWPTSSAPSASSQASKRRARLVAEAGRRGRWRRRPRRAAGSRAPGRSSSGRCWRGRGRARPAGRTTRWRCWAGSARSPSSAAAMRGMKARSARVSRMPEPSALTRVTQPWRSAPTRPGVPSRELRVELERVGEGGVEAAPEHADRPEAGDGAHHDPAVLDGQVLALEQHEAEVAGDVGVLEIGVVERARRQDGDAGVGLGGQALQRVAEGAEEAGEPVDVGLGVEVGEDAAWWRRGSPARSRRPRAPGCGRRAPTSCRRGRGRSRRR